MKLRLRAALFLVAVAAFAMWRSQLFIVTRPGEVARPLHSIAVEQRKTARFDAVLPVVPVGAAHLTPDGAVLVVHFWAPWQRHAAAQIAALDSLAHLEAVISPPSGARIRIAVVCFDPFPSVARYLARQRVRLPVLLDSRRALAGSLPCPSVPYTYVIDPAGRIAVAQAGEVDWLSGATQETLAAIRANADSVAAPRDPVRARANTPATI